MSLSHCLLLAGLHVQTGRAGRIKRSLGLAIGYDFVSFEPPRTRNSTSTTAIFRAGPLPPNGNVTFSNGALLPRAALPSPEIWRTSRDLLPKTEFRARGVVPWRRLVGPAKAQPLGFVGIASSTADVSCPGCLSRRPRPLGVPPPQREFSSGWRNETGPEPQGSLGRRYMVHLAICGMLCKADAICLPFSHSSALKNSLPWKSFPAYHSQSLSAQQPPCQ